MHTQWVETESNWVAPGANGEQLRFQDFPVYHLMNLAGLAKQSMMHRHLEPFSLSMPEWRLLTTVAQHSPIRFARIAEITAMDKAQVSRALRTAQGKGHVQTAIMPAGRPALGVAGASAAGRVEVVITPAGREIHDQVMPLVQRDQLKLLELMTPDERRTLLQFAQRMFAALAAETEPVPAARAFRSEQGDVAAAGHI